MVHKAGAGPKPIPQKQLTVETLTEGIQYCMTSRAQAAAEKMGEQIRAEVLPIRPYTYLLLLTSLTFFFVGWCEERGGFFPCTFAAAKHEVSTMCLIIPFM